MTDTEIKLVVVGDGVVGKTCLLMAYTEGTFPKDYVPTVFDNFESTIHHSNKQVKVSLWDTAGQEAYRRIRILSYPRTDLFIVCFSVIQPSSFSNVREKWVEEIRQSCPHAPFLLVGLKSDLRDEEKYSESVIDFQIAKSEAEKLGALKYLECSALTREGLLEVFDTAISSAIGGTKSGKSPLKKGKKNQQCLLL